MKKTRFCALILAAAFAAALLAPPAAFAAEPPNIPASHALLMDADHDEVLYEKAADERAYPASITKVMTALLVFEAISRGELTLDTVVTPTAAIRYDLSDDGSTQGIQPGEQMTVNDLLHCMLIASANEACNILAEAVCGDISTFIDLMNTRATELGCTGTHFSNTHGLHRDDHYTTARDIYRFVKAAMEYKGFREIVSTVRYTVPATNMSDARTFYTTNALLTNWKYIGYTYSNAIGIKTGHTPEAGQCLAAAAMDGDRTFISVILGAQEVTREDGTTDVQSFSLTKALFQWGFSNFSRKAVLDSTTFLREVPVSLCADHDYVIAKPAGDLERTLPNDVDLTQFTFKENLPDQPVEAPIEEGQVLGTVSLSYQGQDYGTIDLVASEARTRSELLYRLNFLKSILGHGWAKLILAVILILVAIVILRATLFRPRRYGRTRRSSVRRYTGSRRRR